MTPLYFGRSDASLYGVYHPPAAATHAQGVLLCPPFGQEYMRSHRAYRQLASQLSRAGLQVLRFDYRGTGDSSGDMASMHVGDWLDDVRTAIVELKDMAAVEQVSVVGLRLGGLIAAHACAGRTDVRRLVMWDPVIDGERLRAELSREIALQIATDSPHNSERPLGNHENSDGSIHLNGFEVPAVLLAELRALSLLECDASGFEAVLQIVSHETEDFAELRRTWSRSARRCDYQYLPAPHDWNEVDNFGGILLPHAILAHIVGWLR